MSTERMGSLIWILIYGGLFGVCVGFALQRLGQGYGWGVVAVGGTAVLAGAILLWVRSRIPDPPQR